MRTATRKLFNGAAYFLIMSAVVWTVQGAAQGKAKGLPKKETTTESTSGSPINFTTEADPTPQDPRTPIRFKDGGLSPAPKPSEMHEGVPEDTPFKTYLGYPKYQVGPQFMGMNISTKWNYQGKGYNFNTSTTTYGGTFRLLATPQISTDLEYTHYSMEVGAASPGLFTIQASKSTYDIYLIKTNFCSIGNSSFLSQFCWGIDLGQDAYPVLEFVSGTSMVLSRASDIVIGPTIAYQKPFSDKFLARLKLGYYHGTGIGNSGVLESKYNASYFAKLEPEWNFDYHNTITGNLEFKKRKAKLSGDVGGVTDTWITDSAAFSFGLGYLYTF